MRAKLVGYSHYDFTTDDGKHLAGDKLHVVRQADPYNDRFQGQQVDVISTAQGFEPPVLDLGQDYDFYFDKGAQGKAVLVMMVPASAKKAV